MATTGAKSGLYPSVYKGDGSKMQVNGDNGTQNDFLSPGDSLAQDVSSTAVLMARPTVDDELVGEPQEPDDRGSWGGRFDFLMSLLGYSVGLGNVWRFPYLCYANGGGAFLFPFVLMLLLLGFPLMFLELSFGQFASLGPASIFDRICPLFYGLGYGMIAVSSMVSLYYTVIIGWAFLYLFKSMTTELPWMRCDPEWSKESCYSYTDADTCHSVNGSVFYQNVCYNATFADQMNVTDKNHTARSPPAQDFFQVRLLGMSSGIEELGGIQWEVAGCLALAWFLTFLALSKGVQSVGKVVYFTALFPYVVLSILFVRGVTLPGAIDGVIYYLTPDFEKLVSAKTWVAAAVQIFFALSPAWGGLITLSSYNKFHNNCFKDSLIVGIGNVLTSIFAGFVIFPIIGYLAYELDMKVDQVVAQGPGLAFIVFPDVVTRLPASPVWSILFFVMLITLGMGSEFALLETVMTAVQDTFPHLRQKKVYVVAAVTACGFLGGLPICTQGGMYVLQLMDTYAASWSVFLMAVLECTIVAWIYGADKFIGDIEMMIGRRGTCWKRFFTIFWKFLTPGTLIFLLFFNWIKYERMSYADKLYPLWAEALGWVMALIPVMLILSLSIYKLTRVPESRSGRDRNFLARVGRLLRHTDKWGPASSIPKYDLDEVQGGKTVTNPGFGQSSSNPFETRI